MLALACGHFRRVSAAHFLLFPLPLLSDPFSLFAGGRAAAALLLGFSGAVAHIAAHIAKTSLGLLVGFSLFT